MRMVNQTDRRIVNVDLGIDVGPGEECEVADGYARPGLAPNGSRTRAAIENLCRGLVPADPQECERWLAVPTAEVPVPSTVLPDEPMAPGVKEILEQKAADTEALPMPMEPARRRKRTP